MDISRLGNQGVYVCNGDILILSLTTSDASGSVVIRGRVLYRDHEIMPFERVMTFSATGTQSDVVATLTEGYLLGFDVSRASGDLGEGEVIASVHVGRNAGNIQQKMMCLASGEVSNIRSLGMGGFTAAGTVSVPATLTVAGSIPGYVQIPAPAAGMAFQATVPAGEYWDNPKVFFTFTTSAVVANREMQMSIYESGNELYRVIAAAYQTASKLVFYNVGAVGALATSAGAQLITLPLPPLTLGPGYIIFCSVAAIDPGDQFGSPIVYYNKRTA